MEGPNSLYGDGRGRGGFDMCGRGEPGMRGRGGPFSDVMPPGDGRGESRGFRGGLMRGDGGERCGRFPPGTQGAGLHPVSTIKSRGPRQGETYRFF